MPKFFVTNNQIQNEIIIITGEDVNHIVNVLRLKKQDKILVCNKDEQITYQTQICDINTKEIKCKILEQLEQTTESEIQVTVFQGLPKADKMEYIIQKTTELGVYEIVPVAMKRCIVKLEGKDENKKIDRWQKIVEVAAKQSGRDRIPKIGNVMKFDLLKEVIVKFDLFVVAYEQEKNNTLKQVLQYAKKTGTYQKIGVVIGPEGGIEEAEVEELRENGAKIITLGNRILRTETAPIAILSNLMYEFEN